MQKVRRHGTLATEVARTAPTACRHPVSGSLSLPALGCFSPFPHGTGSLSVTEEYLGLEGGPPTFRQGCSCPALLEDPGSLLPVRGCHPLWRAVPDASGSQAWATGLVRVRSSLLAESLLMSFPPATEIFQFAGFASHRYGFADGIPPKGWVAPFGDLGITGRSPLPRAFRSVPRPSSPLGAKASTRCPSRARPRPAPKPRQARPENRCASIAPTGATGPGVTAYPCPGTTEPPPAVPRPRRLLLSCPLHGHDSLHDVKTSTTARAAPVRATRAKLVRASPKDGCPPPGSPHAWWWAWADLNGRPHAYQACALAS
jgi:hypothetical protein